MKPRHILLLTILAEMSYAAYSALAGHPLLEQYACAVCSVISGVLYSMFAEHRIDQLEKVNGVCGGSVGAEVIYLTNAAKIQVSRIYIMNNLQNKTPENQDTKNAPGESLCQE